MNCCYQIIIKFIIQMEDQELNQSPKTPTELKNGPVPNSQRSCTDLFCCIFCLLFIVGVFGIAIYAFSHGDPYKITQGYDPDHRACGHDQAVKDYPLIYFVTPQENYEYRTVCVKSCPKTATDKLLCKPNSLITSCDANLSTDPNKQVIIYPSYPFENKVCIPEDQQKYGDVDKTENNDAFKVIITDLKKARYVILGSVFVAALLSILYIYALDKCGGIIVWGSIILLLFMMFIFAAVYHLKQKTGESKSKEQFQISEDMHNEEVDPQMYLIFAIFFAIVFVIMLVVVICYRKTIQLAIVILKVPDFKYFIIQTASEFLEDNYSTIIIPILGFIITLLFFIFWVSSMMQVFYIILSSSYLYTIGDVSKQQHVQPFGQFEVEENVKYMGYYQIAGLVWFNTFTMAACEFIIIGVVCMWYFQQGLICKSFTRFLKFHTGTTAFGSFLLTVILLIRMMIDAAKV